MASRQLPSTMRKLVVTKISQKFRDVVKITQESLPNPGAGEVLVKNRFVGINASDINYTAGRYDTTVKPPFDCGFEAVGEVAAVGPGASLRIGQPVTYSQFGAFSEYKNISERNLLKLPRVSADYLPLQVSGATAAIALDKYGELKAGETVLVTAAAGGTGQFAVQWAKRAGCHVIGTCSTDDKVQFLKVQWAKRAGFHVIGTCSTDDKVQFLKVQWAKRAGFHVIGTCSTDDKVQFLKVQWAKRAGCHVIGTCSTDDKVQFLKVQWAKRAGFHVIGTCSTDDKVQFLKVQWTKRAGCHVIGTCSTDDKVQFLKVQWAKRAICHVIGICSTDDKVQFLKVQWAKRTGCHVIGICSTDDKVQFLKVQWAKRAGFHVIGTCSTDDKVQFLRYNGPRELDFMSLEHVLQMIKNNFKRYNGPRELDVMSLEHVLQMISTILKVQWAKRAGCHVIGICSTDDKVQFLKVQWTKRTGCHVIGTCSTDDKVQFLKKIGCDRPVNYKKENLKTVLKTEYKNGVDVVYESIGGEMFETCLNGLKTKGRLLVIGYITDYESDQGFKPTRTLATIPIRLLTKSASIRGFFLNHFVRDWVPYVSKMADMIDKKELQSFIDMGENSPKGPFIGIDKIVDAVEYLYSQKSIGKIVVELNKPATSKL
ncbi:PTGR3 [Mytilus edulis]|uniref:PTGR3 n=1 Tax=Mytilus edulis TaxID=6550 RepID=A0A8S3PQQ4_MYTED|nr:PTGR3 [Mytilus edulis]